MRTCLVCRASKPFPTQEHPGGRTGNHDHEKRRRAHHGTGDRQQDRRLPDQTGQSQPVIPFALKKNLENKRLISEKTTSDYMQDFRQIGVSLSDKLNWQEWQEVYRKLVFWELELEKNQSMYEILTSRRMKPTTFLPLRRAQLPAMVTYAGRAGYAGTFAPIDEEADPPCGGRFG